jgi:hypothetical protein
MAHYLIQVEFFGSALISFNVKRDYIKNNQTTMIIDKTTQTGILEIENTLSVSEKESLFKNFLDNLKIESKILEDFEKVYDVKIIEHFITPRIVFFKEI